MNQKRVKKIRKFLRSKGVAITSELFTQADPPWGRILASRGRRQYQLMKQKALKDKKAYSKT